MITIQTFKKALGVTGKNLSEQEVEKLLAWQYQLANVFFDLWQHKTKIGVAGGQVIINKKNGDCIAVFRFVDIFVYV